MPNPAEKVTRNLIHFAYGNQFPEDNDEIAIIALNDEEHFENSVDSKLQIRGTREALKAVALHFKAEVTSKPPKFFERVVLPFQVKFSK